MRILLVSEVFRPAVSGVTITTERLAERLAARGHDVSVLTVRLDPSASDRQEVGGYAVYRVSGLPNPFRPGLRLTVRANRQVGRVLTEARPDVIHIQDVISLSVQAVRLGRAANIPVIATHHFLSEYVLAYLPKVPGLHPAARFWLERRLRDTYGRCAAVTVPSQTVRRALAPIVGPVPLRVISNGIDTEKFRVADSEFRSAHHLPADRPLLLAVGRLDPEKNLETLLDSLALLPPESCHLLIVGSGLRAGSLCRQARSLGIDRQISWIPNLDGAEMVAAYQAADIFCIASPIETESLVTLEAMACGLPVVAADSGALPELVTIGENGRLVAAREPKAWAAALRELIADPDLRSRLGTEGRRRAEGRDIGRSVEQLEDLYRSALRGNVI